MAESFITHIKVNGVRNLKNFDIPLSPDVRQHLILTGKNGSGKTTLLQEINKRLINIDNGQINQYENNLRQLEGHENNLRMDVLTGSEKFTIESHIKRIKEWIDACGKADIKFSDNKNNVYEKCKIGSLIFVYFDAKRFTNLLVPQGVNKLELKKKYLTQEKANVGFIQYIVNLKADRSFARDDNEMITVSKIDNWFNQFENRLKAIFNEPDLHLHFDRKTYNFDIMINGRQPFNFNTLSDGYSAIISIVTELLLRMEAHEIKAYDLEGIAIIDEIETHLHVDLQKKILPFLTDFFPKIQFIVSTHSPFVLSSLSNAVICDLETGIVTSDLSGYSYDALIESFFGSDKYSEELKEKVNEFERLAVKNDLSESEIENLKYLRNYFAHVPKYLSKELLVKLQQIELSEINKNRKTT